MTCPKCHGFLYADPDDPRCLNCSYRPVRYEPAPVCAAMNQKGRCPKSPVKGSDYCLQHEKEEAARRRHYVKAMSLGEVGE